MPYWKCRLCGREVNSKCVTERQVGDATFFEGTASERLVLDLATNVSVGKRTMRLDNNPTRKAVSAEKEGYDHVNFSVWVANPSDRGLTRKEALEEATRILQSLLAHPDYILRRACKKHEYELLDGVTRCDLGHSWHAVHKTPEFVIKPFGLRESGSM